METFSRIKTLARPGVDFNLLEVVVLMYITGKKTEYIGAVWVIVLINSYIRIGTSHGPVKG